MNVKNLQCKCHFRHAVWKHGLKGMCSKAGAAPESTWAPSLDVSAWHSSPRTSCIQRDGPSHMPPVPSVEDANLGSSLSTDELTEERLSVPRGKIAPEGRRNSVKMVLPWTVLTPVTDRATAEKRLKFLGKLCFSELFTQLLSTDDWSKNGGKGSDAEFYWEQNVVAGNGGEKFQEDL